MGAAQRHVRVRRCSRRHLHGPWGLSRHGWSQQSSGTEQLRVPAQSRSSDVLSFPLSFCRVVLDYQFIVDPAYNRGRGPVFVFATQIHSRFLVSMGLPKSPQGDRQLVPRCSYLRYRPSSSADRLSVAAVGVRYDNEAGDLALAVRNMLHVDKVAERCEDECCTPPPLILSSKPTVDRQSACSGGISARMDHDRLDGYRSRGGDRFGHCVR